MRQQFQPAMRRFKSLSRILNQEYLSMSRRKATVSYGVALGVFVCLGLLLSVGVGQSKPAVAPETLLPANSIFYAGWDGIDSHQDGWHATAAYKALVESGLLDVAQKLV